MCPVEWTSEKNFRKGYKSWYLPRSGLLEHLVEADALGASLARRRAGRRGLLRAGDLAAQLNSALCTQK